ncbi:MAG: type II toxin-antitoxin system VapC family toxin [Treponema sp.]|nr:type II toxin-antitoxin system VapC family toxin [Treponema sp.]
MYLLDTNICIYIINKHPKNITQKLHKIKTKDIKISSVTVAELEYGASKSAWREKNRNALYNFLSPFEIINFDTRDAEIYGLIRAELECIGRTIGAYDMQLASQALARDLIFVTNNTNEFIRVKNLRLENW